VFNAVYTAPITNEQSVVTVVEIPTDPDKQQFRIVVDQDGNKFLVNVNRLEVLA